jgi:hypothetical protein
MSSISEPNCLLIVSTPAPAQGFHHAVSGSNPGHPRPACGNVITVAARPCARHGEPRPPTPSAGRQRNTRLPERLRRRRRQPLGRALPRVPPARHHNEGRPEPAALDHGIDRKRVRRTPDDVPLTLVDERDRWVKLLHQGPNACAPQVSIIAAEARSAATRTPSVAQWVAVPWVAQSAREIAATAASRDSLGLEQALVVANPIPDGKDMRASYPT